MRWGTTLPGSPANGVYNGPWVPGDGEAQIASLATTQGATVSLDTSADGRTVTGTVNVTGAGYLTTAPAGPANYYRVRYANGGTPDILPIVLSTYPAPPEVVESVTAGAGIDVTGTPQSPVVAATGGGGGNFSVVQIAYDFTETPVGRVIHTLLTGQILLGAVGYLTVAFNGDPLTQNHVGIAGHLDRYLSENLTAPGGPVGTVQPFDLNNNATLADQALADTDILLSVDNGSGGASGSTAGAASVLLLIGTP